MAEGGSDFQPKGSHLVCVKCLEDNPRNLDLTKFRCTAKDEHRGARNVQVWVWRKEGFLEMFPQKESRPPLRPSPKFITFPGKFKLCYGADRCRGRGCNHPHSIEEMEKWNLIKIQSRSQPNAGTLHKNDLIVIQL